MYLQSCATFTWMSDSGMAREGAKFSLQTITHIINRFLSNYNTGKYLVQSMTGGLSFDNCEGVKLLILWSGNEI